MLPVYLLLACFCLALLMSTGIGDATPIQLLKDSETIFSRNGTYKLGFFSPPNNTNRYLGISYNKVSPTFFVWVANRNNPLEDSSGILGISESGNLEIVNGINDTFWSISLSSLALKASRKIVLLDSGNLQLLELDNAGNSTVIWQTFDFPTDSLLATMDITVNNTTDTRLHAWKGPSDPSEGRFSLGLDSLTNPQIVLWNGNQRHYRTGPWNGNIFLGITYIDPTNDYADTYIQKNAHGEVTLLYTGIDKLSFSHYYLSYDGSLNEIWWDPGKRSWQTLYKVPDGQCDFYGKCGGNGICNSDKSPICQCLRGFVPKNTLEWKAGNWSSGCVRRTPLQCGTHEGEQDGFVPLESVKLPDLEVWLQGANPNDCETLCLNNCSCLAYAYDYGAGCMYWSKTLIDIQQFPSGGIKLQLRVAHSDLGKNSRLKGVIAAAVTIGTGSIIAIIILLIWLNRQKEKQASRKKILEHLKHRDRKHTDSKSQRKLEELHLFDFNDLAVATDNFHINQMLGQGGFGQVYKGILGDGREIAVKRLSAVSLQGVEEFMNEVVVISRLQHKNLVSLIGSSVEGQEKLLVYEYMPNKSLSGFLFDSTKRELLDWDKRLNIIEGICRGLIYLHRDSRLRIIHRDLKASNILLDEEFNPKIADFGMARIFGHGQDKDETRRVVGTYGYMAPEYAMDGHFSEKSDVYSFGVLLLEILTAKKNNAFWYEEESLTLLGYVWKIWAEGDASLIIDPVIFDPISKEIERSIQVGLLCVQENANDRPIMSTVMSMFSSDIGDLPRPKEPGFNRRHVFMDTRNSDLHQHSGENITVTAISGR